MPELTDLTDGEIHALRNLAKKSGGDLTPFLRIADAQRLTELGLATRSKQGWDITPSGSALLARLGRDQGDNITMIDSAAAPQTPSPPREIP